MSTELVYPKVRGFELQEVIGEGGFSKVFRAVDYSVGVVAACKVVSLNGSTSQGHRKELHKEIKVHSQLKHDNILLFLGSLVIEDDGSSPYVPAVYMVLEFASGGDLFDKIAPDHGVEEELAHFYFNQLIDALKYIHGIGVCHRDLKPENILLDALGMLKLSDFGLCSVYKHRGSERTLSERCGSLPYVAPELKNTSHPYRGEPIDVWGAGVILFTLLVGNTPWDEPTTGSPEYVAFLSGEILRIDPWNRIPREPLSLLLKMLVVDPNGRISLDEVSSHSWSKRATQFARDRPGHLADRLAESLRQTGDLAIAEPNMVDLSQRPDEDQVMMTASVTQFTQTLQLFTQTQNGARYDPHLTRFYASILPQDLLTFIISAITEFGLKYKMKSAVCAARIGGYDRRREVFKGVIEVESFNWDDSEGSRCVMRREQGNPTEWRRLWKDIINSPEVEPYVLRRRKE